MKRVFVVIGIVILAIVILCIALICGLLIYVNKNVDYEVDEALFRKATDEETVYYYAYDKNGNLEEVWKSFGRDKREWVELSDVSRYLIDGFIAVEDRDYYSHSGINIKRTVAAIFNYIFKFRDSFGASTITQQVVKNISGDNEVTIKRKIHEIFRAINMEKNHSKDEILEMYVNIIPMSNNINGVSLAAETYFGKEARELSIAEAATIVGITNAPSKYNPYTNPEKCVEKRNRVLYAMLRNRAIDEESYSIAVNSPLEIKKSNESYTPSSWFVETAANDILKDIEKKYNVSEAAAKMMLKGARVILTMSPEIQEILEEFFYDSNNLSSKFFEGMNYAMVVSDPYTGNLLGIIGAGGKKSGERLFNYATNPITPGSTIKPLSIYAPLIDRGEIHWSYLVEDSPAKYIIQNGEEIPYPKNTPDIYEGEITVSEAIKKSKNTVAIKLLDKLGVYDAFNILHEGYGFSNLVKNEVNNSGGTLTDIAEAPLALGQLSKGESLRKLTESYNVFPNGGVLNCGSSYFSVYDKDGGVVTESVYESRRLMRKDTADIINQLLMNVVNDGTARQINLKNSVDTAGKTGTSGGDRDRLFIGYTPYFSAGIWCGFTSGNNSVGFNTPSHLQIWDSVMSEIHDELVFDKFNENIRCFDTSDLILQPYCSISGELASESCELDDEMRIQYGYYSKNNLPDNICEIHD